MLHIPVRFIIDKGLVTFEKRFSRLVSRCLRMIVIKFLQILSSMNRQSYKNISPEKSSKTGLKSSFTC